MSEIIAITVCVNYSDILKHTICQNSKFLKKWYIITDKNDKDTIRLINKLKISNVTLLYYNHFFVNAKFNKGGAIKCIQEYTDNEHTNSNILILDSDIYLPDNFLEKLPIIIEENTLYGVKERLDYWSYDDYINDKNPHKYIYGDKFVGFFQLYNNSNTELKYKDSNNCSTCDMEFLRLFPNKIHIDISVKHLGRDGVNWNGRNYKAGVF